MPTGLYTAEAVIRAKPRHGPGKRSIFRDAAKRERKDAVYADKLFRRLRKNLEAIKADRAAA